jgi:adenine-specific DNA methylase
MEIEIICENKKNGIYYTPGPLAECLVKPLIKASNHTIFDPAYGDGALLTAAERDLKKRTNTPKSSLSIFGCDKHPVNGKLTHLPGSNLSKQDFFDYSLNNKYDVIVMNPPYIRHHLIDNEEREKYHEVTSSILDLKYTSDVWAYFLIKSVGHLKKGGSIGAILPWSFLQAEYAQKIRIWLLEKFEEINILALSSEYFIGTEERVLLVWLKNYNRKTNSIKISFSKDVKEDTTYLGIDKKKWQSNPVVVSDRYDIETIVQRFINEYNFVRFGEIAKIQIGVVTGADKFFVLPEPEAQNKCFQRHQLIPIVTSAKEFSGLVLDGKESLKRLIVFSKNPDNNEYELNYLKEGEKKGFHLRAHSLLRTPWYAVKVGELPDAFFPYRMAYIPYLMINNQAQCTNSIHRIYFSDLSENEKKWIQLSLLSVSGQLAIESYAKTYGRGVLKIEPGALKNSIVYLSDDSCIDTIYNKISSLISCGKKTESMIMSTKFLNKKLGIKQYHSDEAISALLELQNRRLKKPLFHGAPCNLKN